MKKIGADIGKAYKLRTAGGGAHPERILGATKGWWRSTMVCEPNLGQQGMSDNQK